VSTPERPTLTEVLDRIEAARREGRSAPAMNGGRVTLSHGSGGKATHGLIESLFGPVLANPILDERGDAGVFTLEGTAERLAFTTDSFVVSPLFFPGGDIGELAVNGTVNDLAVSGAEPLHLSVAVILEEGFPLEDLTRVMASVRKAADRAGVSVVAGDTKVVEKGHGDGVYLTTSGIGRVRPGVRLSPASARAGDRILVSGPLGDHGVAVMIARERLELESEIRSDTQPLHDLVRALLEAGGDRVRCLRDATRGGLAAVLSEIAERSGVGVAVDEDRVPVRAEVRAACEILGIDAYHMANEGKLVAVVAPEAADDVLAAMRGHPMGEGAARVGEVVEEPPEMVFIRTALGGHRVLDMLVGDALPRIC
jgi:hydrogenase expression/formation protein HypE